MARTIDADALKKALSEAIKDAPLYIQATVDQYIDEAPILTQPNEPLTLISMDDEPPPDKERVLVYRPCMIDSDIGPYSVQWGWAAKKDGSHWAHLPKRRPPEGEA